MFSLSSIPDNVLCNLHMMDLRVTQTAVFVVLLDQSGSHLCGTVQCDNYVVTAMANWNKWDCTSIFVWDCTGAISMLKPTQPYCTHKLVCVWNRQKHKSLLE